MDRNLKKFFKDLVEAPSISGFEQPAQTVYRNFVKPYCDSITTDLHGNVIAFKKGKGKVRLMLSGHADEIGFLINYIDDNGFLYVKPVGGIDPFILAGLRVNIYHNNKVVKGIFGRKAIHMLSPEERKATPKFSDFWIDIGAANRKEALKKVDIGSVVTFTPGLEMLSRDLVATKATDNKAGVYVAACVLRELHNQNLNANIYSVSSVQEEIGIRGAKTAAYSVDPDVGIAIDVTFTTDIPGTDKKSSGDISLGKGPAIAKGPNINPRVYQILVDTAKEQKIDYQIDIENRATGTDANSIQLNKSGVATALISIPNRYMHTPNEVISLKDLNNAVKLIAEFAKKLTDKTNLIP